jgi:hypothetical protein
MFRIIEFAGTAVPELQRAKPHQQCTSIVPLRNYSRSVDAYYYKRQYADLHTTGNHRAQLH